MGGRTFRSRWVVRWAIIFGCICTAAALGLLFVGLTEASDQAAEQATRRTKAACQEQLSAGGDTDDSCKQLAGAGANEAVKFIVAGGVLLTLGITQFVGAMRIGVTLMGPGIIIRNPLRTYRLRWADIGGFRVEEGAAGRVSHAFGCVDLVDGGSRRIEAICATPWERKGSFTDARVIDALNGELAARRSELRDLDGLRPETTAAVRSNRTEPAGRTDTGIPPERTNGQTDSNGRDGASPASDPRPPHADVDGETAPPT